MGQTRREIMLKVAWAYLGKWYIWGGDDPSGFDCSGFVIECCKAVGCLPRRGDWTAAEMAKLFKKTLAPIPGDLVFWKRNERIIHVEILIGSGLSIGASGGGPQVKTVEDAIKHNAFIKVRPFDLGSRPGVWGFVDPFKVR